MSFCLTAYHPSVTSPLLTVRGYRPLPFNIYTCNNGSALAVAILRATCSILEDSLRLHFKKGE